MIQKGQLAYFKKVKGSYKPIGPAHIFKPLGVAASPLKHQRTG